MPSLTDIANQVNNSLNQIQTNTQDTASTVGLVKGDTADIKTRLATIEAGVGHLEAISQAGFANLSAGLAAVIAEQQQSNFLLDYQRQQQDTMICWLTNIASVLCRSLHRLNSILDVESESRDTLVVLREILELVHGQEAMVAERRRQLAARVDDCCPGEPSKPERCYEPCESPRYAPPPKPSHDFTPLKGETPKGAGRTK